MENNLEEPPKSYLFIGDCSVIDFTNSQAEANCRLGMAYLLDLFGPPPAPHVLEVMYAQYTGGPFPCIAVRLNGEDTLEVYSYAHGLEEALWSFGNAVDWQKISCAAVKTQIANLNQRLKPADPAVYGRLAPFLSVKAAEPIKDYGTLPDTSNESDGTDQKS